LKAGLGATAVFREGEAGGKLPVGEREGKEEEEELEGKEEVEELEGKEFGCSFAISSSIETASTSGSRVRNCRMANCCTLCGVERNLA